MAKAVEKYLKPLEPEGGLSNEQIELIKNRHLAFVKIIGPNLEEMLELTLTEKSFKNLFTIKAEGEIYEGESSITIYYLNEKVMEVDFKLNGLEVLPLIG